MTSSYLPSARSIAVQPAERREIGTILGRDDECGAWSVKQSSRSKDAADPPVQR